MQNNNFPFVKGIHVASSSSIFGKTEKYVCTKILCPSRFYSAWHDHWLIFVAPIFRLELSTESSRLASFAGWPNQHPQPEKLAQSGIVTTLCLFSSFISLLSFLWPPSSSLRFSFSTFLFLFPASSHTSLPISFLSPHRHCVLGFFYAPKGDKRDQCRCYICGLKLSHWLPGDDPRWVTCNKTKRNKTEQTKTEHNRTEQNKTKRNETKQHEMAKCYNFDTTWHQLLIFFRTQQRATSKMETTLQVCVVMVRSKNSSTAFRQSEQTATEGI